MIITTVYIQGLEGLVDVAVGVTINADYNYIDILCVNNDVNTYMSKHMEYELRQK